ncbi:uncharacterized protein [Pocillopora verrucosa]|uniref:uncharacterized protein n=1 Tax=Pocillopora verrucosa TaxID=203993 RepID=UPI0033420DCE
MKLQYMCLDSALDLWPPGHFELVFFASRIGRSEMECAALGFSYVSEEHIISSAEECQPPYYEHIEENEYLFNRKKKVNKEVRRMQCDCTLDPGQIMAVTQTSLYAEYGYVHFTMIHVLVVVARTV